MHNKIIYRDDIQTLRAIAILGVIFYHFKLFGIFGGFTGVDVFFVISGYLISVQITEDYLSDKFNLKEFLKKRFWRLFPPYFFMIIITVIISYFILSPSQFLSLIYGALYSISGTSNIYYLSQSGYFDTTSAENPLLHTWSLSVEFQFYFIWSLFLSCIFHFRGNTLIPISFFALISFASSLLMMSINQTSVFYIIFFRIWEFSLGALIIHVNKLEVRYQICYELLYIIGILFIFYSFLYFNELTQFPGYSALMPVVGAVICIFSGTHSHISKIFSQNSIFKNFGTISYSLYLIHWPFITLSSAYMETHIPHLLRIILFLFAVSSAIIFFKVAEVPFKKKWNNEYNIKLQLYFISTFIVAVIGLLICFKFPQLVFYNFNNKVIKSINDYPKEKAIIYTFKNMDLFSKKEKFTSKKERILVIGDSQAADFLNIMVAAGVDKKYEIITRKILWECGSIYIPEAERISVFSKNILLKNHKELMNECSSQMNRLFNTTVINEADKIIIAYFWDPNKPEIVNSSIQEIKDRSDGKIYIIGKKLFLHNSIDFINRYGISQLSMKKAFEERSEESLNFNRFLEIKFGDYFVDPYPMMCDLDVGVCHLITDSYFPIMWQENHITPEAAEWIARNRFGNFHKLFNFQK